MSNNEMGTTVRILLVLLCAVVGGGAVLKLMMSLNVNIWASRVGGAIAAAAVGVVCYKLFGKSK